MRSSVRQLLSEQTGKYRWRRAVILDKLQFDIFRKVYREVRPHFATFFSNSTAHFQHMYWRNMEPGLFKGKPAAPEQAVFERTTVVFCTALGQQACLKYEDHGGKSFYRPRSFGMLLGTAGVTTRCTVSPLMAEQFRVDFESDQDANDAERRLRALRVVGRDAMAVERHGRRIFAGCSIFEDLAADAVLNLADPGRSVPFFQMFYRVEGLKSGMHHPEGMLWVCKPEREHCVHKETVPLTSIAPTILDMFSVPRPNVMGGALLAL